MGNECERAGSSRCQLNKPRGRRKWSGKEGIREQKIGDVGEKRKNENRNDGRELKTKRESPLLAFEYIPGTRQSKDPRTSLCKRAPRGQCWCPSVFFISNPAHHFCPVCIRQSKLNETAASEASLWVARQGL